MSPLRRYAHYLWQEKWLALSGALLALLTALSGIALLATSGWFISATALAGLSLATAHAFNYFAPGALVRGLSISRTAGRYGERITTHEATFRVISRFRADTFSQLARNNPATEHLNTHLVSSRLLEDVQRIESLYLTSLVPGFSLLVTFSLYLLTLYLVLPILLLTVGLPLLGSSLLFLQLHQYWVFQGQDYLHQLRNNRWTQSSSLFRNLRLLTLANQLAQHSQNWQEQARATDQQDLQSTRRHLFLSALQELCHALFLLLTLWLSLQASHAGELSPALVFMLFLLTLGTMELVAGSLGVLSEFSLGMQALERLDTISKSTAQPDDQRYFLPQDRIPSIELQALSFHYPDSPHPILNQLNRELIPGWNWLTAPSGQGKTTLLQLLSGQLPASGGTITLHGLGPGDIQLQPQHVQILKGSLRYNLCLHQEFSDQELLAALTVVELKEWVEQLPEGLDTWLGEGEWQPSGGEMKRIGLARIYLRPARVILLDEPTAGLDKHQAKRILARLRQHWQQEIVLISSHDSRLIQARDQLITLL